MRNAPRDAIAIIFAGGNGTRMQRPGPPKQFVAVGDRPILVHTLQHFQDHPGISGIYIACLQSFIGHAYDLVRRYQLNKVRKIVPGGDSAQASIHFGLESAVADGVDERTVTLIHDGVRPVVEPGLISQNIASAREYGSAITAIPCFETIAMSLDDGQTISSVTRRDLMYVLQAPQTFQLGDVHRANRRSVEDGLLGTFVDQAQLMCHYGHRLHLVEGSRGNSKITTEFDLTQYSLLLDSGALISAQGVRVA